MRAEILDSHHHLWPDPTGPNYDWMSGPYASLRCPIGRAELLAAIDEADCPHVTSSIVVEAAQSPRESLQLLDFASTTPLIAGVVAWVDLAALDTADQIKHLRESPGGHHLVGIRHHTHDERDPNWLGTPSVRRGLAAVATTGLAFDLLITVREMPAAVALAQAMPNLALVVDHAAKPPLDQTEFAEWRRELRRLAETPNVYVKLSGLGARPGLPPSAEQRLRSIVTLALDVFSPERCMLGSDWPVSTLHAPYSQVLNTMISLLDYLTPAERTAVCIGAARRAYSIDRNPTS